MIVADVLILGCGWAGITTAYYVAKKGISNIACIDVNNTLGGLMKTVNENDFVFDIGGSHIIFSPNKHTLEELLSLLNGNIVKHRRKVFHTIHLSNFLLNSLSIR